MLISLRKDFIWALLAGSLLSCSFPTPGEQNQPPLFICISTQKYFPSCIWMVYSDKQGFLFLQIALQWELPQSEMFALSLSLCSCSIRVVWKLQLCVHCHSVLEFRGKVMICKLDPSVILSLEVQFCLFCCQPAFRVQRVLHDLKAAVGNSQSKP